MSRYIDAEKIRLPKGFFEKVNNVPKFYEWLDEQPTADVVEVVQCKDCIYNYGGNCDAIYETLEGDLIGVTLRCSDDFYCAYGERRDDGEIH